MFTPPHNTHKNNFVVRRNFLWRLHLSCCDSVSFYQHPTQTCISGQIIVSHRQTHSSSTAFLTKNGLSNVDVTPTLSPLQTVILCTLHTLHTNPQAQVVHYGQISVNQHMKLWKIPCLCLLFRTFFYWRVLGKRPAPWLGVVIATNKHNKPHAQVGKKLWSSISGHSNII